MRRQRGPNAGTGSPIPGVHLQPEGGTAGELQLSAFSCVRLRFADAEAVERRFWFASTQTRVSHMA